MENSTASHAGRTIADLLRVAVALEQSAEVLYLGIADSFRHHPEVAQFWEHYASQEAAHARWLVGLQERLSADRLAEPIDPQMLEAGERVLAISPRESLREIESLEDAYALADELEHSEMNAIFEFLIEKLAETPDVHLFLRSQLHEHVARLINDFPSRYRGKGQRTATKAQTVGKAE
jgi:rubrerythrin